MIVIICDGSGLTCSTDSVGVAANRTISGECCDAGYAAAYLLMYEALACRDGWVTWCKLSGYCYVFVSMVTITVRNLLRSDHYHLE